MASSAHQNHHHLSNPYGATVAPPPTPSTQSNLLSTSEAATADALSCLLHRLPPALNLSLRSRRSSDSTTTATVVVPPLISLSENNLTLHSNILSAASSQGFFQLIDHSVSSELAHAAESECVSLFHLSHEEKLRSFPENWPLGYGDADESETGCESFCLDLACSTESTELELSSLREFTREMERLGMEVLEVFLKALGFENPTRGVCPLMWISQGGSKNIPNLVGRMYPYVVGLQYQLSSKKNTMLTDSGWVSTTTRMDAVLVTLGDIAQVWSNGKSRKVKTKPSSVDDSKNLNSVSMTLLITLSIESIVAPLLPKLLGGCQDYDEKLEAPLLPKLLGGCQDYDEKLEDLHCDGYEEEDDKEGKDGRLFNSFSFEDYAWRIYHERLPIVKDPLIRYRV